MLPIDILFSLAANLFVPIIIIAAVVYVARKNRTPSAGSVVPRPTVMQQTAAQQRTNLNRDQQWRAYIAGFRKWQGGGDITLLDAILSDPGAPDSTGYVMPAALAGQVQIAPGSLMEAIPTAGYVAIGQPLAPMQPAAAAAPRPVSQPLDNTLLLLYFGAFLFVAAAGLFVAFGGLSGGIRTFLIFLTTMVLYAGGMWLYRQNARLKPAGVAFVAIGMAIAPLTGVAAYHYVAGGENAGLIWSVTSLLCLVMYGYALAKLRTAFISYLVIFSFVSLFESAVSIIDGPTQYYVWMLILAGLSLRAVGLIRETPELAGPAANSAQVIIPLSLVVSLGLLDSRGVGQLSISLLLSAIYYSFEAYQSKAGRTNLLAAAHVLYLLGISLGVYALFKTGLAVAVAMLVVTLLQALAIEALPRRAELSRNFASIAFISALPAVFLAYPNGVLMATSVAVVAVLGEIVGRVQRRPDAYAGGAIALIALPFITGQFTLDPQLAALPQTLLAFVPVLALWGVWAWLVTKKPTNPDWLTTAAAVYVLAGLAALAPAAIVGGSVFIGASLAFALTLAWSARAWAGTGWWAGAGAVLCLPVLRLIGTPDSQSFTVAVLLALVGNIAVALISRAEFSRWVLTALTLITPAALGAGGLGFTWGPVGYSYAFLAASVGLILCRSLARGVYLPSSKVPIISMCRSASLSYVTGYISAAGLAIVISLTAVDSRLHTSVILGVLLALCAYVAVSIEKNKHILAFVPWLAMGLLVSLFRPYAEPAVANGVILGASLLAVTGFVIVAQWRDYLGDACDEVLEATWLLAFVPILLGLFYNEAALVPPLALAVAGGLTLYHKWHKAQSTREMSGGVIVLSAMWALYALGVHNAQAYSHILAATFAAYAYWRYTRGDRATSDQYLYGMLGAATIPLILQALGGQAGDLYGWWLLLEQIGFMIVGIIIGRKFVTFWGLYVAIGAVLYQLRNLGWAALSFLALFIIGIAIYRLMKSNEHK